MLYDLGIVAMSRSHGSARGAAFLRATFLLLPILMGVLCLVPSLSRAAAPNRSAPSENQAAKTKAELLRDIAELKQQVSFLEAARSDLLSENLRLKGTVRDFCWKLNLDPSDFLSFETPSSSALGLPDGFKPASAPPLRLSPRRRSVDGFAGDNGAPSALFSNVPTNPFMSGRTYDEGSGGSNSLTLSSALVDEYLPDLPNMDYGFIYEINPTGVDNFRFFADALVPFAGNAGRTAFAEIHFDYQGFPSWTPASTTEQIGSGPGSIVTTTDYKAARNRMNISAGGGYRAFVNRNTFLGINAFYDGSRIFGRWYSSWGWGLETAALVYGGGMADLRFNHYGNQFRFADFVDMWRHGDISGDIEAGYSTPLGNSEWDLRFKLNGYQYGTGSNTKITGLRYGAELTFADGLFTASADYGSDRSRGSYASVSGWINLGFQAENILRGESPFTRPEQVFAGGSRNTARLLTQRVRRNRNLPPEVVSPVRSSSTTAGPRFVVGFDTLNWSGVSQFIQSSATDATWSVLQIDGGQAQSTEPDRTVRILSYQVSIAGDTGGITGPITVNVTPSKVGDPPIEWFAVRSDGTTDSTNSFNLPTASDTETVTSPGFGRPSVRLRSGQTVTAGDVFGTITVTSPSHPQIPALVITVVYTGSDYTTP